MSDVQAMPTAPDLHHQLFTDSPAATSPPPPLQIKYVELYTDKTSFAACSATVTTDPVSFSFSILSLLGLWFCHFGHGPLKDSVCYCAAKMVIVFVKNSVSARGVLLCKSVDSPYLLTTTSPCVSITFHHDSSQSALLPSHPFPRRWNYCARVWTRQTCSLLRHRCVSITLRLFKH
uniref:Uncharacterized protein n=1 Tax=Brassica oleracea TaxID=3712 RepID=A0A3P6DYQ7_BRAOL|nr:unnamed protein product [Brassica oleracea]